MARSDAHLHLFAEGYRGRYGRSPAGGDELAVYQGLRRVHGIERALVVGYEGRPEHQDNNRYLAGLAREHPWLVPVAYLPPGGPTRPGQLADRWAEGFAGIAVYLPDEPAARQFTAWDTAVVDELNRRAALVSLNAAPRALAVARPALSALTNCGILVSHLGLPGATAHPVSREQARHRLDPLLRSAALPQVTVKVSGLYATSDPPHAYPHRTARPYLDLLLDAFGTRRLCWGSDFPVCLDAVSFAQALDLTATLPLPSRGRADVEHGTLARLLDRVRPG